MIGFAKLHRIVLLFKSAVKLYFKLCTDYICLPLSIDHFQIYSIIHRSCLRELGSFPDLVNCRDFNDRIQWLKLFDQDREIIRCSDKLRVRERVHERLGEEYLAMVYQVANCFSEIRFEDLPGQFVIKTNHDSGSVLIVRDKSMLDYEVAKNRFDQSLRRAYGWDNGEWAYAYITPMIFIEECIGCSGDVVSPPDYKFQCVNGRVVFVRCTSDRGIGQKEAVLDRDGKNFGFVISEDFDLNLYFVKPSNWHEMIIAAEAISQGFKCVRVDLYSVNGRIVFGEMTFYPMAGLYRGEGQRRLGKLLNFDSRTTKPFLIPTLEAEQSRFSLYSEGL